MNEAHCRRDPGHRRTRGRGNGTTGDQGTEQYCNGRGTGPGHARLVAQGTNSVAAVMAGVGGGGVNRGGGNSWWRLWETAGAGVAVARA